MVDKAAVVSEENLQALKEKNDVLKRKIREYHTQNLASDKPGGGKRNLEKDLAIKRRKLDDLKSKTATKRA